MSVDTTFRPVTQVEAHCDTGPLASFPNAALAVLASQALGPNEQDTVTLTGVPTGGTFAISVTAGGSTQTTAGLAFNATAATVQTAVQGLSNVGAGNAIVTLSGSVYTITFVVALAATAGIVVAASGALLTGGTNPAAVAAQVLAGQYGVSVSRYKEVLFTLNYTTVTGTSPSLTFKVQVSDDSGTTWYDLPAAFYAGGAVPAAVTAAGKAVVAVTSPCGALVRGFATVTGTTPVFQGYINFAGK